MKMIFHSLLTLLTEWVVGTEVVRGNLALPVVIEGEVMKKLENLTKETIEQMICEDLLKSALNVEEYEKFVAAKGIVDSLTRKAISNAEKIVSQVKDALCELENIDEAEESEMYDSISDWAYDFAYDFGLEYSGGEFWERSTCY